MSSETWQEIFGLLALLPWIGFVVAVVLFEVLGLRDDVRAARRARERARPDPRSGLSVDPARIPDRR
jgi:hypothetical protein